MNLTFFLQELFEECIMFESLSGSISATFSPLHLIVVIPLSRDICHTFVCVYGRVGNFCISMKPFPVYFVQSPLKMILSDPAQFLSLSKNRKLAKFPMNWQVLSSTGVFFKQTWRGSVATGFFHLVHNVSLPLLSFPSSVCSRKVKLQIFDEWVF